MRTSSTVWRRTSVGCAVITGVTTRSPISRSTAARSSPARSRWSKAAARLPSCGCEPCWRWKRRRRSWWTSSAVLASSDNQPNALIRCSCWSIGRWGRASASESSGLRPPRRASTARRRTASTRSKTSSPACSRTTSPRIRPSRRMSPLRAASLPRSAPMVGRAIASPDKVRRRVATCPACRDSNRSAPCATPPPPNRSTSSSPRRTTCCHPRRWRVSRSSAAQHRPRRRPRWRCRSIRPSGGAVPAVDRRRRTGARRRAVVHALPDAVHRRHGLRRDLVGVIGALEVVDEGAGGVLPHERTTPKASTDRLDLTRATRANLSPVWGLSLAAGLTGLLQEPGELVGEVTVDGVVHRVERITERRANRGDQQPGRRSTSPHRRRASSLRRGQDLPRRGPRRRDTNRRGGRCGGVDAGVRRRARCRAAQRRGDPPAVLGVERRRPRGGAGSLVRPVADRPADAGHAGGDGGRRIPRPRRPGHGAPTDTEARRVRRRARPRRGVAGACSRTACPPR